jgi:hypothetical protein
MGAFDNRVLKKAFGPKRNEVTAGWIKLYNDEPHDLYSSPNIISMIKKQKMVQACSTECVECIQNFGW